LSAVDIPAAASPPAVSGAWIGQPPSLVQRLTVFWIGLVGVLFPGVGPLLLGGMEAAGRLTANQLGLAGMAELVAMGIGAAVVGPLFGERRLRLAAVTCGLLLAALDLATTRTSGDLLILVRAVAGLPAGAMIWLITGMIVRSPRPERWAGLYLTIQTLLQLGVVSAIGAFVIGPFGPDGGFVVLAVLTVSAASPAWPIPAPTRPWSRPRTIPRACPVRAAGSPWPPSSASRPSSWRSGSMPSPCRARPDIPPASPAPPSRCRWPPRSRAARRPRPWPGGCRGSGRWWSP
jgi:hypothetical protein